MRYFFIDLENVRSAGLEGVLMLTEEDSVFVFYSDNCYTLSIPTLESINSSKAAVKYIKTNYIGQNAMDFQIVSLFGAMIERTKKGAFYIISNDNGFKSAVSFCLSFFEEYGISAGVHPTIIGALKNAGAVVNTKFVSGKETQDEEKKKHSRRRRRGHKGTDKAENPASEEVQNSDDFHEEDDTKQPETDDKTKQPAADMKTKQFTGDVKTKQSVADKKTKQPAGDDKAKQPEADENAKQPENGNKPAKGNKQYIYDKLSDLLSEGTIDIYCDSIHEGIGKSANKNELYQYFKTRHGEDEGEALYRVVQGDFDAMKECYNSLKKTGFKRRRYYRNTKKKA